MTPPFAIESPHALTGKEVVGSFGSDGRRGLSRDEVDARLAGVDLDELPAGTDTSPQTACLIREVPAAAGSAASSDRGWS